MLRMRIGARPGLRWGILALVTVVAIVALGSDPADARSRRKHRATHGGYHPPYAAMVIDVNSGKVLHAANADSRRHPASLTKIMTLYLLFEQLDAGKIRLDTPLTVSARAAAQAPTKLGLLPGATISVEDAIKAIVTRSANDIAVVVAEAIAGDEDDFAKLMTRKAHQIGMTNTVYINASGLPEDNQVTTARDQAVLGRAIQERFPRYYRYFATASFSFRGAAIRNHNRLLGRVAGVDGIKTGYTRDSGFNLVTSVHRGNRHLVAVVLGGSSASSRDARMRELIEQNIVVAADRRTAMKVAEAPIEQRSAPRAVDAVPTPMPAPARMADATPTAAIPVTATEPRQVPGSSEPIQPISVKTIPYRTATLRPTGLAPVPLTAPQAQPALLAPAPIATTAPPPPPGTGIPGMTTRSVVATPERAAPATAALPEPAATEPSAATAFAPIEPPPTAPLAVLPATPSPAVVSTASMAAAPSPTPLIPPVATAPLAAPPAAPAAVVLPAAPPVAPVAAPIPLAPPAAPAIAALPAAPTPAAVDAAPPAPPVATASVATAPATAAPTTRARGDWMIQVGAFEQESEAKARLRAVQDQAKDTLGKADPFTERVVKGAKEFFRARFAGFDRERAEAACKVLKRNDIACLALKN
jgi:D-alanyl-D-alanine carboxypeptidase